MFDLTGQIAFVTGAAEGLGLAMTEIVAACGAKAVMSDPNALGASVDRLKSQAYDVIGEIVEVADTDLLVRAIDGIAEREGRLDIVFANAGLSAGSGPLSPTGGLAQVDLDRWNYLLQTNLTSVFVTIRTASAHMMRRRYGGHRRHSIHRRYSW